MSGQMDIFLQAKLAELEKLNKMTESFAKENSLSGSIALNINLVCEELFSNFLKYGTTGSKLHRMHIKLSLKDSQLTIIMRDNGGLFNPLEMESPNINLGIVERPIGGLGIYLVQTWADELEYQYENGENIVTLKKNIEFAKVDKEES
jgi:anti-sigma regulatory factor (Ser/Thr protein kinase)